MESGGNHPDSSKICGWRNSTNKGSQGTGQFSRFRERSAFIKECRRWATKESKKFFILSLIIKMSKMFKIRKVVIEESEEDEESSEEGGEVVNKKIFLVHFN